MEDAVLRIHRTELMSLHTISLNGESLLLFLAPVDWAEGVAITHG
jgi:hypothetical protein